MPLLSADGFAEDVREAERVIVEATGDRSAAMAALPVRRRRRRAPSSSARLRRTGVPPHRLGRRGLRVGSRDERPTRSRARASRACRRHGDGAIVLLHTWPDPVAPALAEIVEGLRARRRALRRRRRARPARRPGAGRAPRPPVAARPREPAAARPSSPSTAATRRSTSPSSRAAASSWRSSPARRSRTSRCRWRWRWTASAT